MGVRAINVFEDSVTIQHWQCANKAGVKFSRQRHEMHERRGRKRQEAACKHQDANLRRSCDGAYEWRDHQQAGANSLDRSRELNQPCAQPQRRVGLLILYCVSNLVSSDSDSRQGMTVKFVLCQSHGFFCRVVVVAVFGHFYFDGL